MQKHLPVDLTEQELAGLALDRENCFEWPVPSDKVSMIKEAIGEPRNFRMDVSGERLHFEGCVVGVEAKDDFSAIARIKMLTLPRQARE